MYRGILSAAAIPSGAKQLLSHTHDQQRHIQESTSLLTLYNFDLHARPCEQVVQQFKLLEDFYLTLSQGECLSLSCLHSKLASSCARYIRAFAEDVWCAQLQLQSCVVASRLTPKSAGEH